jgi:hypothetical protein
MYLLTEFEDGADEENEQEFILNQSKDESDSDSSTCAGSE